jgi:hypothetical protein
MRTKDNGWTVLEEQQLIDLKCENKSYLEIAEIMYRTPDSLRKKHWLLMREKETNPTKFWEKIKELEELGYFEEKVLCDGGEEVFQNPEEPEMKETKNAIREVRSVYRASNIVSKTIIWVSVFGGLAGLILIALGILKLF